LPSAGNNPLHPKKRAFLAAYAACGNLSLAASAARVHRLTHYKWLKEDEYYAEEFTEAREVASDALEAEARRRAVEGVEEPVIYQGELMGVWVDKDGNTVAKNTPGATLIPLTVTKRSDLLLIFLLKGARPDIYRERREISGPSGGPLLLVSGPRSDSDRSHLDD
jgi:hypothetical protein